jgi:hypothetical protein
MKTLIVLEFLTPQEYHSGADISGTLHAMEEHHCNDHAYFLASCESCRRAREAFLPYHNVDPHPEKSTRSFQTNLGPAFVAPAISPEDQMKMAATSGIIRGLIRGFIDVLFGR